MKTRQQPTRYSEMVIRRVRQMRKERGWSAQRLVDLLADAEFSIGRSTIANIETGRRDHLTVDELCALAAVFGVSVDHLVNGPKCGACFDSPPHGFACLNCGATNDRTTA